MTLSRFIQQLKDRVPISHVLGRHLKLIRRSNTILALCPFHHEKTPSFHIQDDRGSYHCFGCGAHGDAFSFLVENQKMEFKDAVEEVARMVGISVPAHIFQRAENKTDKEPTYQILELSCAFYQQQLKRIHTEHVRTYLKSRGVDFEMQQLFAIGFAPESSKEHFDFLSQKGVLESEWKNMEHLAHGKDRFRGRLIFPIFNERGHVCGFGGRALGNHLPKYLNSAESETFHKSKTLYGLHLAKKNIRTNTSYVVVEGYLDVILMHQAGIKTAVAPLGTALTSDQIERLWQNDTQPIICFDGDTAGQNAARRTLDRVLPLIKNEQTLRFCFLPNGEDPASLVQADRLSELNRRIESPQSLVDMLWDTLTLDIRQNLVKLTPESQLALKNKIFDVTGVITQPHLRKTYQETLLAYYTRLLREHRVFIKYSDSKTPSAFGLKNISSQKQDTAERLCLLTLINHPDLITELPEMISVLDMQNPLHQNTLDQIMEQGVQNIDVSSWNTERLYTIASFARATSSLDVAREGWLELLDQHFFKKYSRQDLQIASQALKSTFEKQHWDRVKALKSITPNFDKTREQE